ncbi:MAG TPA: TonB-dependent receptor [Candidatus Acidoferrum sp.]|nr:TonB-dependent receptor [Candidatus Acidoferrum sp.]
MRYGFRVAALFVVQVVFVVAVVLAQTGNSGSIEGTVLDPSGKTVGNATVEITNVVSGLARTMNTAKDGSFRFTNVPFNPYHLSVNATGFAPASQDVEVRSFVAARVDISMTIGTASTTVLVESNGADLVETDSTFHTDLSRELFENVPLESSTSSVSSLVTLTTPGVAADSNGLFHGLGDHAENSFSVDGQPITDQQSKVFSNQIPSESIQSLEVISGAPPAEFGDKTSLVIKVTTRSGLGVSQAHGSVTASYGSFGTPSFSADLAYGGKNWGNFVALSGLQSGRFLDPPEHTVMHDKGNEENFFDRVDYKFSDTNTVQLNLGYTRSWFQTPNSFDAQYATAWNGLVVDDGGLGPNGQLVGPTDQRSKIGTFNVAPTFVHLIGTEAVFTIGAFVRQDQYHYYPSADPFADFTPNLQGESIGQARRLTNAGVRSDVSYVKGVHNIKAGITYEHTFLTENDSLGIVDPTLLPSLADANGNPCQVNGINLAAPCTTLAPYDLTAGGKYYFFRGHTDVKELALYAQDTITKGNWSFNLGIRGDFYNGLSVTKQAEPRLGIAYNIKPTNTVLRLSYARILETPFNENLVLASEGCNDPVVNALMSSLQGYPCLTVPVTPGFRNEFHAGFQQAFGKYLMIEGEYMWKYTHNAYDFSILGNTPITFPIEWHNSKIPGYMLRASVPNFHGFSAYFVASSVAARFFQPQVTGIGATPAGQGGTGVFRIDHDELFNQTSHLQYQPWKRGPWVGVNWRYDSGLVAGPVPCFGGNCAGDQGAPGFVNVSGLTPDQQFQAGLFCGSVVAAPPSASNPLGVPISANGMCSASQYGSTLLQIPKPGTEDDDKNPPRVASRNLFDIAVGEDNLFGGDRRKWSLRFTVINLANKYALYNFLSTFSGTHYVTPRTETIELGFHF